MTDANKLAFQNIIDNYIQHQNNTVPSGRRYIKTNDEEKEWLRLAQITESLVITPEINLQLISHKEELYIIIIGVDKIDTNLVDEDVITAFPINAGLITLLMSAKKIKLRKNADYLQFYNDILFQHEEKGYEGHDYEDIVPHLEQIQMFHVTKNSVLKTNILNRSACYFFTLNENSLVLDFSNDVNNFINELSLMGSDKISFELITNCIFSTSYKHAFLELYRLIERLFSVNYLKEFHKKTKSNLSFLDFVAQLEVVTGWRPKELDAIEKIFNSRDYSTSVLFENFHNSSIETQDKNHAKFFYDLRNSIVHFRANHTEQRFTNEQWNLLIHATLCLIDKQYSINDNILV